MGALQQQTSTAKMTEKIDNFSGGINTSEENNHTSDWESRDLVNFTMDSQGSLKRRLGTVLVTDSAESIKSRNRLDSTTELGDLLGTIHYRRQGFDKTTNKRYDPQILFAFTSGVYTQDGVRMSAFNFDINNTELKNALSMTENKSLEDTLKSYPEANVINAQNTDLKWYSLNTWFPILGAAPTKKIYDISTGSYTVSAKNWMEYNKLSIHHYEHMGDTDNLYPASTIYCAIVNENGVMERPRQFIITTEQDTKNDNKTIIRCIERTQEEIDYFINNLNPEDEDYDIKVASPIEYMDKIEFYLEDLIEVWSNYWNGNDLNGNPYTLLPTSRTTTDIKNKETTMGDPRTWVIHSVVNYATQEDAEGIEIPTDIGIRKSQQRFYIPYEIGYIELSYKASTNGTSVSQLDTWIDNVLNNEDLDGVTLNGTSEVDYILGHLPENVTVLSNIFSTASNGVGNTTDIRNKLVQVDTIGYYQHLNDLYLYTGCGIYKTNYDLISKGVWIQVLPYLPDYLDYDKRKGNLLAAGYNTDNTEEYGKYWNWDWVKQYKYITNANDSQVVETPLGIYSKRLLANNIANSFRLAEVRKFIKVGEQQVRHQYLWLHAYSMTIGTGESDTSSGETKYSSISLTGSPADNMELPEIKTSNSDDATISCTVQTYSVASLLDTKITIKGTGSYDGFNSTEGTSNFTWDAENSFAASRPGRDKLMILPFEPLGMTSPYFDWGQSPHHATRSESDWMEGYANTTNFAFKFPTGFSAIAGRSNGNLSITTQFKPQFVQKKEEKAEDSTFIRLNLYPSTQFYSEEWVHCLGSVSIKGIMSEMLDTWKRSHIYWLTKIVNLPRTLDGEDVIGILDWFNIPAETKDANGKVIENQYTGYADSLNAISDADWKKYIDYLKKCVGIVNWDNLPNMTKKTGSKTYYEEIEKEKLKSYFPGQGANFYGYLSGNDSEQAAGDYLKLLIPGMIGNPVNLAAPVKLYSMPTHTSFHGGFTTMSVDNFATQQFMLQIYNQVFADIIQDTEYGAQDGDSWSYTDNWTFIQNLIPFLRFNISIIEVPGETTAVDGPFVYALDYTLYTHGHYVGITPDKESSDAFFQSSEWVLYGGKSAEASPVSTYSISHALAAQYTLESQLPKEEYLDYFFQANRGEVHNGQVFTWVDDDKLRAPVIFYSDVNNPTHYPLLQNLVINDYPNEQIVAIKNFGQKALIFTKEHIYQLEGSSIDDYKLKLISSSVGALSADGIVAIGNALYFVARQGIFKLTNGYSVDGDILVKQIDHKIKKMFIPEGNIKAVANGNKYMVSQPGSSMIYIYDIELDAWFRWELGINDTIIDMVNDEGDIYLITQKFKYLRFYRESEMLDALSSFTSHGYINLERFYIDSFNSDLITGGFRDIRPNVDAYPYAFDNLSDEVDNYVRFNMKYLTAKDLGYPIGVKLVSKEFSGVGDSVHNPKKWKEVQIKTTQDNLSPGGYYSVIVDGNELIMEDTFAIYMTEDGELKTSYYKVDEINKENIPGLITDEYNYNKPDKAVMRNNPGAYLDQSFVVGGAASVKGGVKYNYPDASKLGSTTEYNQRKKKGRKGYALQVKITNYDTLPFGIRSLGLVYKKKKPK